MEGKGKIEVIDSNSWTNREYILFTGFIAMFLLFLVTFQQLYNIESRYQDRLQDLVNNINDDSCFKNCLDVYTAQYNYTPGVDTLARFKDLNKDT